MSETETATQSGPTGESAVSDTDATAPADTGAATETPVESTVSERAEKRIAKLAARLSAGEQQLARLVAENEQLRRGARSEEGAPSPEIEAAAERRAQEIVAERTAKERMAKFHSDGRAAHADWSDRCQSLMQMGADAQLSHMLVELDNGARVAGALADDPEALERIAAIQTERGRAISLGMYAAKIEATPAPPVRRVSNAPAPIRPVTGGARVEFNPYGADSEALVDYYSREAMKARGL